MVLFVVLGLDGRGLSGLVVVAGRLVGKMGCTLLSTSAFCGLVSTGLVVVAIFRVSVADADKAWSEAAMVTVLGTNVVGAFGFVEAPAGVKTSMLAAWTVVLFSIGLFKTCHAWNINPATQIVSRSNMDSITLVKVLSPFFFEFFLLFLLGSSGFLLMEGFPL